MNNGRKKSRYKPKTIWSLKYFLLLGHQLASPGLQPGGLSGLNLF